MTDLPDDWFEDHDGQCRVLNVQRVGAEIERLKADLATFGKDTEATENRIIDAEFAAQWMRTALEDIAEGIWHPDTPPAEIISDVRQRAKAALAGPAPVASA